jgi:hypothetical protein
MPKEHIRKEKQMTKKEEFNKWLTEGLEKE